MAQKLNFKSASVQLIAIGLIITILPIAILTYMGISSTTTAYDTMDERLSDSASSSAMQAFQARMQHDDSIIMSLSTNNDIIHALENKDHAALKKLVDDARARNSELDALSITDASGTILARGASDKYGDTSAAKSIQTAVAGNNYLGLEIIPEAVVTGNNFQERVSASGTSTGMSIAAARPIRDSNGKVIGTIVAAELINSNTALVDSMAKNTKTDITIFQGDTRIATTMTDGNGQRALGSKASSTVTNAVVANGGTYSGKLTLLDKPYYAHYTPLKAADGTNIGMLFSGVDLTAQVTEANNSILQAVAFGTIIALLAAGTLYVIVTRITKPMNRLVVAANSVAAGNLDTSMETGAKGGEIGELTESIKKMVANTKDRIVYNETILKGIVDPLYVVDRNAVITYANEPGAKFFGTTADGVTGRKFSEFFTILNSNSGESNLAKCLRTGEIESDFEIHARMKDGREVFVRGSNAPIRDAIGNITGAVETLTDITKDKEAEMAIQKAEQEAKEKALFSESILKAINDAHAVTDSAGKITYINEVCMKMLDISEKETIGRTLEEVLGISDSVTRTALVQQENIYNVESHVISRRGKETPVLINVTLLRDTNGIVSGANAMFKDISKEKAAKKQLAEITASANQIAERVSSASGNVASSVQQVMTASKQISDSIQQIASGSQDQSKSVENVNQLMHDMSDSIATVNEGAKKTSDDAVKANAEARKGSENAKVAIRKMEELHDSVNDSAKIVAELGEKSKQIGQIVDMITAIAGQTNLLALNAAIEAARAGDAGRGFAVVAEEVRKLAEESAKAADEINLLIGEVSEQTTRAVESMNKGTKEVDESNKIVAESLRSLEDISRMIDTTAAKAQEIAAMTEKQATDTQRIVKDVEAMAAVIEESAAGAEEVSASSEETTSTAEQVAGMAHELAKIADELKAEVGKLKAE